MARPLDIISEPEFDRDVRRLRKKYRRIGDDIRALLREFNEFGIHGDVMVGFDREVRKVRLTNRSANRGKSGGFRALYVVDDDSTIRMIRIYSKSEESSLSRAAIRRVLKSLP